MHLEIKRAKLLDYFANARMSPNLTSSYIFLLQVDSQSNAEVAETKRPYPSHKYFDVQQTLLRVEEP